MSLKKWEFAIWQGDNITHWAKFQPRDDGVLSLPICGASDRDPGKSLAH
eukprot:SAG31_NODE_30636_length_378_cov_0.917563_1_plen_48_part_10